MTVWAIGDLHLALAIPEKKMDFFGEPWINYTDRIEKNWCQLVGADDLVLIPGDISWATKLEDAKVDLEWIDALPGTKVLIRGNHEHWWTSLNKVQQILPPSIHVIQNNIFNWKNVTIGGARLWDTSEYKFNDFIAYAPNPRAKQLITEPTDPKETEKIFVRELGRLELSLKQLNPKATVRIALTHYPPIGPNLQDSRTSQLLEKYQIHHCLFGHLHNVKEHVDLFGLHNHVHYHLVSADYLNMSLKKILTL